MSWAALEARWRIHADSKQFRGALDRALFAVNEALEWKSRKWMGAISGGKDSLALAYVLKLAGLKRDDVRMAHAACEFLTPGMTESAEACADKLDWDIDVFDPDWSPYADGFEFLASLPRAQSIFDGDLLKQVHRKCASGNMLVAYQYDNGYTASFSGMRAEESRGRTMNRRMRGAVYHIAKDDTVMCQPIVDWNGIDVWAAIMRSGLEYPAHYRLLYERFGISPESPRSRVDSLLVTERVQTYCGSLGTAKVLYPKLFEKLIQARPELKRSM